MQPSLSTFECLTWIIRHTWLRSDAWRRTVYQWINNLVPTCLHWVLYKHWRLKKRKKPGGHYECITPLAALPKENFPLKTIFGDTNFRLRHISFRFASVETWKASVNTYCIFASHRVSFWLTNTVSKCADELLQVLKIILSSHVEFVLHSSQENGLAR